MVKLALAVLVSYIYGECPNACSGHGSCQKRDSCKCFQNYQGNDCSEKTCWFGIAFVDTPKGDLNADGRVSGPLTTVVKGSEVYPWGTTEQYPNADANEGHFYMECSNKGICDRVLGVCECFAGYEGAACARAACPDDGLGSCSGHGTCETIKELAELQTYDSTAQDTPVSRPVGSHLSSNSLIEESYSYDLWDADKSMGCKCDPGFYGPDCSLKKCKYGVDPLFYDNVDGVIYQTTVVHLGSKGTSASNIKGTFDIVFFDVFGEKYHTKPISATTSQLTSTKIVDALQALPNDVISRTSTDVSRVPPPAVTVSMHAPDGTLTTTGGLGAGAEGNSGAGLGTMGRTGPEFTVTFSTNPGVLKSIEIDSRQVSNAGISDYWVANMRQGQFHSRYTTTLGRVNTLLYGSKYLYTNTDYVAEGAVADGSTLVKVGGQEFLATMNATEFGSHKRLTLNEPFLGASILPILTDTGAVATSIDSTAHASLLGLTAASVTTANTDALATGAALYVDGCPVVSSTDPALGATTLGIADTECLLYLRGADDATVDLAATATDEFRTQRIFRRSDDPGNQNVYKTSADAGVEAADGYCFNRGSTVMTACAMGEAGRQDYTWTYTSNLRLNEAEAMVTTDLTATAAGTVVEGDRVWLGDSGPFDVSFVAPSRKFFYIDKTKRHGDRDKFFDFFGSFSENQIITTALPIRVAHNISDADADAIKAGTILLMNGRRYKVQSTSNGDVTLTEKFAGSSLLRVCDGCLLEVGSQSPSRLLTSQQILHTKPGRGSLFDLRKGEQVLVGGQAQWQKLQFVAMDYAGGAGTRYSEKLNEEGRILLNGGVPGEGANALAANTAYRCAYGGTATATTAAPVCEDLVLTGTGMDVCTNFQDGAGTACASDGNDATATVSGASIYKVNNANGYKPIIVTESPDAVTYQYVSQCSNRGVCDEMAGICDCFIGYAGESCNMQNMASQ